MNEGKERLSWKEIDQLKGQSRMSQPHRTPRGSKAKARAKEATKEYLKRADRLFSGPSDGAQARNFAKEIGTKRGQSDFDDACRAFIHEYGTPADLELASIFLDSEDDEVITSGLKGLLIVQGKSGLALTSGLRARLRTLAQHSLDHIAYSAEDLLR